MPTLLDARTLGTDTEFIGRCITAAFREADLVSDELPATAFHVLRVNYATLFYRVPEAEGPKLAMAIATNSRINGVVANATDANIVLALRDVWNGFAGVVTT